MHYVSVEGISKSYGITGLFDKLSFNINEGDKIALVARNGVGKSSLLKILAGKDTPDNGKVWINKDVNVALFEQDNHFEEDKTVLENIFHTEHPIINAIKLYEAAVESNDGPAITHALTLMDELQAWNFEAKVKQILTRLNIHDLQQPVKMLSGGQRRRIALAQTLIDIGFERKHSFLMMDEPTNHLDVQMIEWLEHYLNQENVTLLLVTHDRYFLDAVADEIWELERENLYTYRGDYENFLEKKAARIESEQSSINKARNDYRKELEWMRKQPKARTTKSKSRQDNFYEVEERAKQKIQEAQMQLQVKMSRLGGKILELKKLYKSYGDTAILKGFDYTFSKGERIGIIGKNGVGKSTFLNIIQDLEKADSGKVNIGDTVVFGNFAQKGLDTKENIRVIEYVKSFAENFPLADGSSLSASQFLELFLFTPDKQYTYIQSLSGGEKKRLQLLSILFRNPNFLILDEPTNDLDLPTLNVLENFLADYPGCILIVSHDRYFMDRLVDHLFVFEGDGIVKDFPGNYTQYRFIQKEEEKKQAEEIQKKTVATSPTEEAPAKKKMGFREKKQLDNLEREIANLEKEKKQAEEALCEPNITFDKITTISNRIAEIIKLQEEKEMKWLELSE